MSTNGSTLTAVAPVTNGASSAIEASMPYVAHIKVEGVAPILFHAWNCEAVEAKAKAAKGSAAKKNDDIESYVYRCPDGTVGIPGSYLRGAICNQQTGSAKFRQDPRSPRKSALDLYRAGIVVTPEIASLGKTTWDFIDQRRVTVQRSAITRQRPAFLAGWVAEFDVAVILAEYISPADLRSVIIDAGRLVGVGDFRPTYGRFDLVSFSTASAIARS